MPLTLLDIAKRNGSDLTVGLIDETTKATPEVSGIHPDTGASLPGVAAARTIRGINYKTLVRTALPAVSFRGANQGVTSTQATYENRLVETFLLNPRWHVDKAVGDMSEDGWQALLADEAIAHMNASMQQLGRQFYYGARTAQAGAGAALGFPGLLDALDATMTIDAGGSTAGTGSSVWAVKFGPQRVQWVFGNDGRMEPEPADVRDILDATGKPFSAYVQEILVRPGLQVSSWRYVARIKKLTGDSGCGLTDAKLNALLECFPVGERPDAIFLTKRSRRQLRDSRTATNADGREAKQPMDFDGIPLVPTESLLDTEPLTL